MKRYLLILAVLAVTGGAILYETGRGQVPGGNAPRQMSNPFDFGPGEQGATLRQPGAAAPEQAPATPPPSGPVQGLWNQVSAPFTSRTTPAPQRVAMLPSNRTEINQDIEVTPQVGPWLILVMTYGGANAPQQARRFVEELRDTYKIKNAYIFNFGAEEKRKEYERVEAERKKQREALQKAGLTTHLPIPVRAVKIQEHTGVLIGGYRTRDEALAMVKYLRKLNPPDPAKVDLDMKYAGFAVPDKQTGNPVSRIFVKEEFNSAYVNPFKTAFPVRNPLVKEEEAPLDLAAEIAYLRKINKSEPLSLFHCDQAFTLAVKQFKTAMMLQENPNASKGFLAKGPEERVDYAAQNAHNLAETFRKAGLPETYVLHTRFCSYVTVGGYDNPNDPRLLAMQNFLEGRFKMDALRPLELMPRPVPMEVPH